MLKRFISFVSVLVVCLWVSGIVVHANYDDTVLHTKFTLEFLNSLSNEELNEITAPHRAIIERIALEYGVPMEPVYVLDEDTRNHVINVLATETFDSIIEIATSTAELLRNGMLAEALTMKVIDAFRAGKITSGQSQMLQNEIQSAFFQDNTTEVLLEMTEGFRVMFESTFLNLDEKVVYEYEVEPHGIQRRNQRINQRSGILNSAAELSLDIEVSQANLGGGWVNIQYNLSAPIRYNLRVVIPGTISNRLRTTLGRSTLDYIYRYNFTITNGMNTSHHSLTHQFHLPHPRG